jgi:hypothetical protein
MACAASSSSVGSRMKSHGVRAARDLEGRAGIWHERTTGAARDLGSSDLGKKPLASLT